MDEVRLWPYRSTVAIVVELSECCHGDTPYTCINAIVMCRLTACADETVISLASCLVVICGRIMFWQLFLGEQGTVRVGKLNVPAGLAGMFGGPAQPGKFFFYTRVP